MGLGSFIWGGNTGVTAEDLARRRALSDMFLKGAVNDQPQDVPQGISAIGKALMYRLHANRLGRDQSAAAASAAGAFGGLPGLYSGFGGGGGMDSGSPGGAAQAAPATDVIRGHDSTDTLLGSGGGRGQFVPAGNFVARGANHVDPQLVDILKEAAGRSGYRVEAYSGYRPGDKRQHGRGNAVDIRLIDPATGKAVPNYQNAGSFRAYEKVAQEARRVQMEKYPDLANSLRWGGYFSGGKGKYGAVDLMHFDLGGKSGLGMAGGSWDKGLTAAQKRLFPGIQSAGLAGGEQVLGSSGLNVLQGNAGQDTLQDVSPPQAQPFAMPQRKPMNEFQRMMARSIEKQGGYTAPPQVMLARAQAMAQPQQQAQADVPEVNLAPPENQAQAQPQAAAQAAPPDAAATVKAYMNFLSMPGATEDQKAIVLDRLKNLWQQQDPEYQQKIRSGQVDLRQKELDYQQDLNPQADPKAQIELQLKKIELAKAQTVDPKTQIELQQAQAQLEKTRIDIEQAKTPKLLPLMNLGDGKVFDPNTKTMVVDPPPAPVNPIDQATKEATLADIKARTAKTIGESGRSFTILSEADKAKLGLDPKKPYQMGVDGKISGIGSDGTTVNIDQKAEGAFSTEVAKTQAKRFDEMFNDGQNAKSDLALIEQLGSLTEGVGGFGAGFKAAAASWGIKLADDAPELEAAQAIIAKIVPAQRIAGSGTMSDNDLRMFQASVPSLWNTPGGNAIIMKSMRSIAEYRIAQGEIAAQAQAQMITPAEATKRFMALKNPLADFRKIAPPAKKNDDALPPKADQNIEIKTLPKAKLNPKNTGAKPDSVDQDLWNDMTEEERREWIAEQGG